MTEAGPAGFRALPRLGPYIDAMGPFFIKEDGETPMVGLRVAEKHINTRGFVHGGLPCSLADIALGYAIAFGREPPLPLVRAHLSVDFAGAASLGDWLEARVDLQKLGARLAFGNCYIWRGSDRIVRASGVFALARTKGAD